MTKKDNLRTRAEDELAHIPENLDALTQDEIRQTLHELRVHQIELELQNEELRQTQLKLETARARYFDLYDLAPVGYCTLDDKGLILEANLSAANLLGVARRSLVKQFLTRFILKNDQDIYYLHHKQLFESGEPQACELHMVKKDGTVFSAHLAATISQDAEDEKVCRIMMSDITERTQAELKLQYLSMHDALTGLYNRGYFEESMERIEHGRQYPVSILMADVDDLKITNDRYGHAAGDSLLKSVARLLKASFRAEDVVARIGGDEFAVLMPGTTAIEAEGALLRLRQLLDKHNKAGTDHPLSLSCGVGTADMKIPLIETLKQADANMYLNKQGRDAAALLDHPAEQAPLSSGAMQARRRQAEEWIREKDARLPDNLEALSNDEIRQTLHELHVYQIELELQNEELRRAQAELEIERARYYDLFDMAPVGYMTLSENGIILETNLTAAGLLNISRTALIKRQITRYILKDDQDIYYRHRKELLDSGSPQTCELRMLKKDGDPFWAHLEARLAQDSSGEPTCRISISDISRLKQMEQMLRESEVKYRTVADFTYDCESWLAPNGGLLYISPSCERLTGYRPDEFIHDPKLLLNIAHPSDQEALHRHRREELSDQVNVQHIDYRICTRQGEERWLSHYCTPVYGDKGEWLGRRTSDRDITARKRGEEEIRRREKEFSTLVEHVTDIITRFDTGLHYIYCNPAVEKQLGIPINMLIGKTPQEFGGSSQQVDFIETSLRRALETGEEQEVEQSYPTRSGMGYFHTRIVPEKDKNSKIESLLAITRDISARRQMEDTLRQNEEFLSNLLENAPVSIYVTGADGRMRLVNQRWRLDTGMQDQQVIGRPLEQIFSPETTRKYAADNKEVLDSDAALHQEEEVETPVERRQFYTVKFPLRNARGQPEAVGGISMDITERKRVENALRASLAEKEVLLREVHHRVKNNLATTIGLIGLQMSTISDPAAVIQFHELEERLHSMALVHEQLYRSVSLSNIDFSAYLRALVDRLAASYDRHSKINIRLETMSIALSLDYAIPCGLIVNELVTNAYKYAFPQGRTYRGRKDCTILVLARQEEGLFTLGVSDNGVGLPPDLDWESNESLGLKLVHLLGEKQLHGRLEVDTRNGASYRLYIGQSEG